MIIETKLSNRWCMLLAGLVGSVFILGSSAQAEAHKTRMIGAKSRVIVPGVRAGAITARSTHPQLVRLYGKNNVRTARIPVGEGETVPGLILFKGTPSELLIRFKAGTRKIELIEVAGKSNIWRTKKGIRIGSTAQQIEKLNGRAFNLFGFEWDYAGRSAGWRSGKISKAITVDFAPSQKLPHTLTRKVIGDAKFSSRNKVIRRMKLTVHRMLIWLQ
jgi:hypothetical protein